MIICTITVLGEGLIAFCTLVCTTTLVFGIYVFSELMARFFQSRLILAL